MRRHAAWLGAGLGLLMGAADAPPVVAQADPAQVLAVPVYWCTVGRVANGRKEGALVFTDPGLVDQSPTTDHALWRRHERASDHTYIPFARINLRSAFPRPLLDDPNVNFPVLEDPGIGALFPGDYGDVLVPEPEQPGREGTGQVFELNKLFHDCEGAWLRLSEVNGVRYQRNTGLMAINIRQFVESRSRPARGETLGVALKEHPDAQMGLFGGGGRRVAVEDLAFEFAGSPRLYAELKTRADQRDSILAHEAGHAWSTFPVTPKGTRGLLHTGENLLPGGAGCGTQARTVWSRNVMRRTLFDVDAPPDKIADTVEFNSDIDQLVRGVPNPMGPQFPPLAECERVDQVNLIRRGAPFMGGCRLDGTDTECEFTLRSDYQLGKVGNIPRSRLDIAKTTFTENDETTGLGLEVFNSFDGITTAGTFDYVWMLDLDNDRATGGPASSLGIPSLFRGIEVIAQATVRVVQQPPTDGQPGAFVIDSVVPAVWTRGEGGFEPVEDPYGMIRAGVPRREYIIDRIDGTSAGFPAPSVIWLEVPTFLRGPRVDTFRIQALSRDAAAPTLAVDRLDDSAAETGVEVHMAPAVYPTCFVSPRTAQTGATVTVTSERLLPNKGVHVILGENPIATGTADGAGVATVPFKVPIGLSGGPHLVTIGSDNTALTGDCIVEVQLPAACASDTVRPTFQFVPPALTISACASPNIGMARAIDACGPTRIVSDAPATFPLGTTTVTWRAIDPSGNVATATQRVTAVLGDDASCCPANTNVIAGSSLSDTLRGTEGRDCILGRDGDDIIDALGGDDFVSCGAGRDTVNSGFGNDLVQCGAGDDTIDTGPGNDTVRGEAGRDTIMAGTGSDTVDGGPDTDTCALAPDGADRVTNCEIRP